MTDKTESRRELLAGLGALVAGAGILGLNKDAIASSALRGIVDEVQRDRIGTKGVECMTHDKDGTYAEREPYDKVPYDKVYTQHDEDGHTKYCEEPYDKAAHDKGCYKYKDY